VSRAILLSLADRCEREEATHDLDVAIAVAAYDLEARPYATGKRKLWWYKRGTDGTAMFYGEEYIPRYTTSIDAAVTLVPEGMAWTAGCEPDFTPFARLWEHDLVWASTPALALCAAALRARASLV